MVGTCFLVIVHMYILVDPPPTRQMCLMCVFGDVAVMRLQHILQRTVRYGTEYHCLSDSTTCTCHHTCTCFEGTCHVVDEIIFCSLVNDHTNYSNWLVYV